MLRIVKLTMIIFVFSFFKTQAQIQSDFLVSEKGRSSYFEFDNKNYIHIVWEEGPCKYSILNSEGDFLIEPKFISDTINRYVAKPTLSIRNDYVACIWEERHIPLNPLSTYIRCEIINNGAIISNNIYADDSEFLPNDALRRGPVVVWYDDTTLFAVWYGNGSKSFSFPYGDIYYKKLFMEPFRKAYPLDRTINNSYLRLSENRQSIFKKKNSEGFIITWCEEDSLGYWNVAGESVNDSLVPNGKKIIYKEKVKTPTSYMSKPAVLQKTNGNYLIIWEEDETNTTSNLYMREYTEEGTELTQTVKVNDTPAFASTEIAAAIDSNNNFIIIWEDGKNLQAQRYYSDLSKKGNVFQVNKIVAEENVTNIFPHVRLHNGRIYTSWTRDEKGAESIWMNILDFDNPVYIQSDVKNPIDFSLIQNYPNPFNPTTTIKFSIPDVGTGLALSILKVYDILGREVVTLVNERQPAGTYEVKFNAVNLPSGVYFYQLRTGTFSETKKMILMK